MKVETPEIADQVPESEALPADLDAGTLPEAAVDSCPEEANANVSDAAHGSAAVDPCPEEANANVSDAAHGSAAVDPCPEEANANVSDAAHGSAAVDPCPEEANASNEASGSAAVSSSSQLGRGPTVFTTPAALVSIAAPGSSIFLNSDLLVY